MYRYTTGDKSGSIHLGPTGRKVVGGLTVRLVDIVMNWVERARQRRHLAQLDDRLLRDIGVSRAEVEAEISRPFWRPEY